MSYLNNMLDLEAYPLILLGIILITQICKNWIKPKFGKTGVQLFIAALSFILGGIFISKEWFSINTLATFSSLWVAANGIYQIIGKIIFDSLGEALAGAKAKIKK